MSTQPSKSHQILARRNGEERYFTFTEWKTMPKSKYGWIDVSQSNEKAKNAPPEAIEATENAKVVESNNSVTEVTSLDDMNAKQLIAFVESNELPIEGYSEMTKSKLLKAIKEIQ